MTHAVQWDLSPRVLKHTAEDKWRSDQRMDNFPHKYKNWICLFCKEEESCTILVPDNKY